MHNFPFFKLLIPLITGIIIQYYNNSQFWGIIPLFFGLGIMLFSFFIRPSHSFGWRWLFGAGSFFLFLAIGIFSTAIRQNENAFNFPDIHDSFRAQVIDVCSETDNSVSYKIKLLDNGKKIIGYFKKEETSEQLAIGDNFIFFAKIQPFEDIESRAGFSYARYMSNKGYSGFAFIPSDRWEISPSESSSLSIQTKALQIRQSILRFYHRLNLSLKEESILSALTLGYTHDLSDNLINSFRTVGISHLWAISGMHIGIIFFIVASFLSFIPRNSKYRGIKYILSIVTIWTYVFIIGLPASAVRACIMLSAYCVAQMGQKKIVSLNIVCATAFLMLVWNPLQFFDIGFQMSFVAVLSMLLFIPIVNRVLKIRINSRILKYFGNLLTVSLSVQIGLAPLCLYYFGTYPTYSLIANLVAIPCISLIFIETVCIFLFAFFSGIIPLFPGWIMGAPIYLFKTTSTYLTQFIGYCETLPFAQIENGYISLISLLFIWVAFSAMILGLIRKESKLLILSLSCFFILIVVSNFNRWTQWDSLSVYYNRQHPDIQFYVKNLEYHRQQVEQNELLDLKGTRYLLLAEDVWKERKSEFKFRLDYLHIVGNSVSLFSIIQKFDVKHVIIDSSLPNKTKDRLVFECEKLRIPYYDVSHNGTLRLFF